MNQPPGWELLDFLWAARAHRGWPMMRHGVHAALQASMDRGRPGPEAMLAIGGSSQDYGPALSGVEMYVPSVGKGQWSRVAGLNVARFSHAAAPIPGGVMTCGGKTDGQTPVLSSCEVYRNPAEGWVQVRSMPVPRYVSRWSCPPFDPPVVPRWVGHVCGRPVERALSPEWSPLGRGSLIPVPRCLASRNKRAAAGVPHVPLKQDTSQWELRRLL